MDPQEAKTHSEWTKKINKSRYVKILGAHIYTGTAVCLVCLLVPSIFDFDNFICGWVGISSLVLFSLLGIGKVIAAIGVTIDEAISNKPQKE